MGEAVREAIDEGICTRGELFITSKMWVQDMESYDKAKAAIDASLEKDRACVSRFVPAASGNEGLFQRVARNGGRLPRGQAVRHRGIEFFGY